MGSRCYVQQHRPSPMDPSCTLWLLMSCIQALSPLPAVRQCMPNNLLNL